MRLPQWLSQHLAGLRALLVLTVIVGLAYPLAMTGVARIPGLRDKANGSIVDGSDGEPVGSRLIGQLFTDDDGNTVPGYFQPRPSAAGDGYDPTATAASNLGPESIEDTLPSTPDAEDGNESLLTQVCARSLEIGTREGVSGARPYCTADGVGAVLRVFHRDGLTGPVTRAVSVNQACPVTPFVTTYEGVQVECGQPGQDYSGGVLVPVRGDAPTETAVPADAVTASGSGLDPEISPAYAELQLARVARERDTSEADVQRLVDRYTTGRAMGFMGAPGVNVLELNLALDRDHPIGG
jgi:K+-transporting ATPase ATPase C chain